MFDSEMLENNTSREILQQPETWLATADQMLQHDARLEELCHGVRAIVLTGSGSSQYSGECLVPVLQRELGVPVQSVGGGSILTEGAGAITPLRPCLAVSFARSGDSPESSAAVELLLRSEPEVRHLVITCNRNGKLAKDYANHPRVFVITLEDRTNDRSLVMTSSFTNMLLACRILGFRGKGERYRSLIGVLSKSASHLLDHDKGILKGLAASGFDRAVFLGSGARYGAARECALKMLEMTDGRVVTFAETYLGLRHGPMSAINSATLIVCFLSSGPGRRPYETDLIREIEHKKLGNQRLLVGEDVPYDLASEGDVMVQCPGIASVGDDDAAVLDVVVGQLLGFFRCLQDGLDPDSPSSGAIHRVVESFPVHGAKA
ncbi:MAG: SIS domain-containing protein [Bryobacteraceae bacterium]